MDIRTCCLNLLLLFVICGLEECSCEEEELEIPRSSYCDSPVIPSRDGVNVYNHIDGFDHKEVTVIYDDRINRTEFLSVTIQREQLRYYHSNCLLYRSNWSTSSSDVYAQIIPHQLGGSCDSMNKVQLGIGCVKGMLLTFENWIRQDVELFISIKYCVQMLYSDDEQRRPYEIIYRSYSHPFNKYLHSIALDNPWLGNCKAVPHVM